MEFKQLNIGWNAEPNAPNEDIQISDSTITVRFHLNTFQFPSFSETDIGILVFSNVLQYRYGSPNDEGFFCYGQSRYKKYGVEWGEFYQVIDSDWATCFPDAIAVSAQPKENMQHYLFYFRDATFECIAGSYTFTVHKATAQNKPYSILFIGNSYTYFNDMPTALFQKIAESAGYTVQVTSITKGGWTLEKHADIADEYGKAVDAALRENRYDYVILQEQSVRPASEPEKFYAAVRSLADKIRANGAAPILYATWGRKSGSKILAEHGWTNEVMTEKLAAAYRTIGKEIDAKVAYAGLAFYDVNTLHGDTVDLYDPDLSHPSAAGSYLAALTLFTRIFDADPTEVTFNDDLPQATAAILKKAAKQANMR